MPGTGGRRECRVVVRRLRSVSYARRIASRGLRCDPVPVANNTALGAQQIREACRAHAVLSPHTQHGRRTLLEVMEMFVTLIVMITSRVYAQVKLKLYKCCSFLYIIKLL